MRKMALMLKWDPKRSKSLRIRGEESGRPLLQGSRAQKYCMSVRTSAQQMTKLINNA